MPSQPVVLNLGLPLSSIFSLGHYAPFSMALPSAALAAYGYSNHRILIKRTAVTYMALPFIFAVALGYAAKLIHFNYSRDRKDTWKNIYFIHVLLARMVLVTVEFLRKPCE
jgi:hypothetical protein